MVMPCSRSSVRPSVKSERSRPAPPRRAVLRATAASWSSTLDDREVVREIDARHGEPLARDVLPDVELGPVGEREDAQVLARAEARVVEAPELGPLVARVPLTELVAMREDALLGARLLL